MIVVDEYLAIRSLTGVLPADLPDEPLALTTSAHWRILQRIHGPGTGQLSQALGTLSPAGRTALRKPVPDVLEVLDPRPMLDQAAAIAVAYGNTGWLVSETLVAGLVHGRQLWFGSPRNVGRRLRQIAGEDLATLRRLWEQARRHIDTHAGPDRRPQLHQLRQREGALPTLRGIHAANQGELARLDAAITRNAQSLTDTREHLETLSHRRWLRRPDQQAIDETHHLLQALERYLGRLQEERDRSADKLNASRNAIDRAEHHAAQIPAVEEAIAARSQWILTHPAELAWETDLATRIAQRTNEPERSRADEHQPTPDHEPEPALLPDDWLRTIDLSARQPRAGIERRLREALGLSRHPGEADIALPPLPGRASTAPTSADRHRKYDGDGGAWPCLALGRAVRTLYT